MTSLRNTRLFTVAACGLIPLLAVGCFAPGESQPTEESGPAAVAEPATPAAPVAAAAQPKGGSSDHIMFGGTPDRNMVNFKDKIEKLPPQGPKWDDEGDVKKWSAEWLLWKEDLGSRAYGGPIIAGGKVFVGTNNERPRNKRDIGKNMAGDPEPIDKGIVYCFDEKSGKFLWQAVHDKLPSGQVHDWPKEGLCSTPYVEGSRAFYVSNQCRIVCADVDGFANGNDGPYKSEKYTDPTDVDIVWEYDMIRELNVFPHNMSACSPLIIGDIMYIVTANGVDEGHVNIPSPEAPSFIALDKNSGKLLWKSNAPGKNIMHGQWSNAVYAEIGGVRQVIFPGGDGWIHSFSPEKGEELWKFDCNPKDAVYELGGTGTRNDFIGTPVVYDNKVYIGVGQDPEHTTGIGNFWCINPAGKKGDISPTLATGKKDAEGKPEEKPNPNSGVAWVFGGEEKRPFSQRDFRFGRTMSTACIVDDILYISELAGYLHCLNAKTGEHYWQFDTKASIWGSPYYVDGRVLLANDNGDVFVFRHDKKPVKIDEIDFNPVPKDMKEARTQMLAKRKQVQDKVLIGKIGFDAPIRSTPIVSNGVLYVMSEHSLFAVKTK